MDGEGNVMMAVEGIIQVEEGLRGSRTSNYEAKVVKWENLPNVNCLWEYQPAK